MKTATKTLSQFVSAISLTTLAIVALWSVAHADDAAVSQASPAKQTSYVGKSINAVNGLEMSYADGAVIVRIKSTAPLSFTHKIEPPKDGKNYRVILDCFDADYKLDARSFTNIPLTIIEAVRGSQHTTTPDHTCRIVLDLRKEAIYRVEQTGTFTDIYITDRAAKRFATWRTGVGAKSAVPTSTTGIQSPAVASKTVTTTTPSAKPATSVATKPVVATAPTATATPAPKTATAQQNAQQLSVAPPTVAQAKPKTVVTTPTAQAPVTKPEVKTTTQPKSPSTVTGAPATVANTAVAKPSAVPVVNKTAAATQTNPVVATKTEAVKPATVVSTTPAPAVKEPVVATTVKPTTTTTPETKKPVVGIQPSVAVAQKPAANPDASKPAVVVAPVATPAKTVVTTPTQPVVAESKSPAPVIASNPAPATATTQAPVNSSVVVNTPTTVAPKQTAVVNPEPTAKVAVTEAPKVAEKTSTTDATVKSAVTTQANPATPSAEVAKTDNTKPQTPAAIPFRQGFAPSPVATVAPTQKNPVVAADAPKSTSAKPASTGSALFGTVANATDKPAPATGKDANVANSKDVNTAKFRRSADNTARTKGTMIAEFPQRLSIKYASHSTRDPFESLWKEKRQKNGAMQNPTPNVENLTMVGVLEDINGARVGLFEDLDGIGYILGPGDKVQNGSVLRIESDKAYFTIFEYGWSRTVDLRLHDEL